MRRRRHKNEAPPSGGAVFVRSAKTEGARAAFLVRSAQCTVRSDAANVHRGGKAVPAPQNTAIGKARAANGRPYAYSIPLVPHSLNPLIP